MSKNSAIMNNIPIQNDLKKQILPEIMGAALCLTLGMASGFFIHVGQGSWYMTLKKPWFNPPDWIFAPIWTLLYILLGISLGQMWKRRKEAWGTWILFITQLILNFAWSALFFHAHFLGWALFDLSWIWGLISLVIFIHRKHVHVSGWLWPYWIWISFAWILNYQIYQLNRS